MYKLENVRTNTKVLSKTQFPKLAILISQNRFKS